MRDEDQGVDESRGHEERSRGPDLLLLLVFVLVCAAPLLTTIARYGESENTRLGPPKPWAPGLPGGLREAASWPGRFRHYFENAFGLRDELIALHAVFKHDVLGVSPNHEVLLGHDDFLFLAGERTIDYHVATAPSQDVQLERWTRELRRRSRWLAERRIPYLVVVAPNKHSIYPELLPSSLRQEGRPRLLARLRADLGSELRFVDPSELLLRSKSERRVYHRTDTHWNRAGGRLAAHAILEALGGDLRRVWQPQMEALGALEWQESPTGGDLSRLIGLQERLREPLPVVPSSWEARYTLRTLEGAELDWHDLDVQSHGDLRSTGDRDGPTALVLRDSFCDAIGPWLCPVFSQATWVWSYGFDEARIEEEQPDYVIQQLVERKLLTVDPEAESESR